MPAICLALLTLADFACATGNSPPSAPARPSGPLAQETRIAGNVTTAPVSTTTLSAIGWASVEEMGQSGTTGGIGGATVEVANDDDLGDELDRPEPLVVRLVGTISGSFDVGSNKTLEGAPGAILRGHLEINGSANVIVRNLTIVGYNCADREECKKGKDAVTIEGGAHHVWFDHCDISDGSDGNVDIVGGADYVTMSWTKFHYSSRRPGDHQFSSLIGSSDQSGDTDAGHLNVTFHHCWWADNVDQRMPRARFGKIHIFNSLYTAAGNSYCLGPGVEAQFLVENTIFSGIRRPVDLKYTDQGTVVVLRGNVVENVVGQLEEKPGAIFTPPYPYALDPVDGLRSAITRGAGPQK
jgi:pectate lyase